MANPVTISERLPRLAGRAVEFRCRLCCRERRGRGGDERGQVMGIAVDPDGPGTFWPKPHPQGHWYWYPARAPRNGRPRPVSAEAAAFLAEIAGGDRTPLPIAGGDRTPLPPRPGGGVTFDVWWSLDARGVRSLPDGVEMRCRVGRHEPRRLPVAEVVRRAVEARDGGYDVVHV